MPKKPGAYYRPTSLSEALQLLEQPGTLALAGGTQLLAREEGLPVAAVVDLQALDLQRMALDGQELRVGATATLTAFAEFLNEHLAGAAVAALLQKSIHQTGPNTVRNASSVGGVVAGRLPDSELLAALLVLEARLLIHTSASVREVSLAEYLGAAERPPGLITEVRIPRAQGRGHSARVARTPADDPIVSITCWWPAGESPRLAATGLSARPFRLAAAEAAAATGFDAAAAAASTACSHPGDFRGDSAYRAEMAAVLVRRVLEETRPE